VSLYSVSKQKPGSLSSVPALSILVVIVEPLFEL